MANSMACIHCGEQTVFEEIPEEGTPITCQHCGLENGVPAFFYATATAAEVVVEEE